MLSPKNRIWIQDDWFGLVQGEGLFAVSQLSALQGELRERDFVSSDFRAFAMLSQVEFPA